MFCVSSDFIGSFKVGDNIHYNLECLAALYSSQSKLRPEDDYLLVKPIVIANAAIAEALLHDLFFRAQNFTKEGLKGIAEKTLEEIRNKTVDQFATYIAVAEKHDLLGDPTKKLYEELHALRKLRNRVHIQNIKRDSPIDESDAFDEKAQEFSEKMLEELLSKVSSRFPRDGVASKHLEDFKIPWARHGAP